MDEKYKRLFNLCIHELCYSMNEDNVFECVVCDRPARLYDVYEGGVIVYLCNYHYKNKKKQ